MPDPKHPDELYETYMNPEAPLDEHYEVGGKLTQAYVDKAVSDGSMGTIMQQMTEMVKDGQLDRYFDAELQNNSFLQKSYYANSQNSGYEPHRRSAVNADYVETYAGWVREDGRIERPQGVNFSVLRKTGAEIPTIQQIISLRRRQMDAFCQPPVKQGQTGFEICHKDLDHQITNQEKKVTKTISNFILNSGFEEDTRSRVRMSRQTFQACLSQMVEQTLLYDAIAIETERNRLGDGINGYYMMDGSMTRLIDARMGYNGDKDIYMCEVDSKETVRAAFTLDQGFYFKRNPSSHIQRYGYGTPEQERLFKIMNSFAMALDFNAQNFNRNTIPKGMLQLFGNYDKKAIEQLKREWMAQMHGLKWRHGFPIIVGRDKSSAAEWVKTGVDFNEMAFARWITFLTSTICALYGVSPEEINMESFSARQTTTMSGNDMGERMASAKDKGFKPLLRKFEDLYNEYIMPELDDRFVMRFVGLEPRDEAQVAKQKYDVQTVNEQRAELGLDKHPDELQGNSPVEPQHLQLYMQEQMGGMEPQQQEQPEEEPKAAAKSNLRLVKSETARPWKDTRVLRI